MKPQVKKILIAAALLAAAIILAIVLSWILPLNRLLHAFEYSWRFKIGYAGAIVLLAASAFLLFKRLPAQNPVSLKNGLPGFLQDDKKLLLIGLAVVLLFWAPYLFKGPDIHVKIFDNLDCHIPQTKTLAESGKAFSLDPGEKLDNFLNGIPLSGVDSGYNGLTWLFMIFSPFAAYALNELIIRIVALLGMFLFLKTHVIKEEKESRGGQSWLIAGAALCFALTPFYLGGGISIAGIPLLLYAFFNILGGRWKYTDFLVIFLFPFYSRLALAGVFIAIGLTIIWVVDIFRNKKINLPYLGGLALLTAAYVFTHFHLVYSLLSPDFTSFREEIDIMGVSTAAALKNTVKNFLFERVNVAGAHHIFVVAAAALAAAVVATAALRKKENSFSFYPKLLAALTMFALANSFFWGFKYWEYIMPLRENNQFLNAFDLSRFYWFNPFLWYIIFALALLIIARLKKGRALAALFIIGQLVFTFVFYNWEYRHMLGIRSSFAGSPLTYSLTYREFYSPGLFQIIDRHIGRPKQDYRVISLGIHPGIAQYNGFYTLDIYTDIYPLEYKHQFRKIIEKELAKSSILQRGFDGNAKRCFLLAAELHGDSATRGLAFSRGISKYEKHLEIKQLDLNTAALKAMGGEYIFSAVPIRNFKDINLELDGIFKSKASPWKIYLYRVL